MLNKNFFTKVILLLFISFIAKNATAQQYSLVKDINTAAAASGLTDDTQSAVMDNILFFTTNNDANDNELWKSDGTETGTVLVKSIKAVLKGTKIESMTVSGNTLFFVASTIDSGAELWKSDGTEEGTIIVTELGKGATGAGIFVPANTKDKNKRMIAYRGNVYFNTPQGVFKSDGTEIGTVPFFSSGINMQFEILGDALYLSNGSKLYISQGQAPTLFLEEGTKGYSVTGGEMTIKSSPLGMFFTGKNTLWLTRGILAETSILYTAPSQTPVFSLNRSVSTPNKFFFVMDNKDVKATGLQVWATDGTAAGTIMVKTIGNNTLTTSYTNFSAVGKNAYFWFSDGGATNLELWKTDGVFDTTIKLATFSDNNNAINESNIGAMLLDNGKTRFTAQYADGVYMCKTDGTVAGTVKEFKIAPFNPLGGRLVLGLKKVGASVLFSGNIDTQIGNELYRLGEAPFTLAINVINKVKCNGDKNGVLEAFISGASAGMTYNWASGEKTATISNIGAGKYSVTVTSLSGTTAVSAYTMVDPAKLTAVVNTSSTPAGQKLGRASVFPSGGLAPYQYLWNTNPVFTINAPKNLASGTYNVTITDANQCKLVKEAVVSVLAINFTQVKPLLCNGDKNAEVEVNVPEWTAGVNTYLWSQGSKTAKATGLGAGTYTVTITSANNVAVTVKYDVVEPKKLTLTSVLNDEVSGAANGSIKLTAAGGTGAVTYKWSSPITSTSNEATALTKGTYTVTATDANGCTAIETYTLVNSSLSLTQKSDIKCFGDKTGSLDATTVGAVSYTWNTGANTPIISGLGAGTYSPTVTLSNGQVLTGTKEIKQPTALIVTTTTSDATGNQSNGKATAVTTGGTPAYTYVWATTPAQNTAEAINLVSGTYKVSVTDANGCISTTNAIVKNTINTNDVAEAMGLNLYPNPTSSAITLSIKNALSENYNYQIIDILGHVQQSGIWSSQNTLISVDALPSGTYLLTLKSEKGRVATTSFNVVK
jgi:ELWxxDGT repeat protein